MSFTYNDEGIRTSKTVDNVKHTYHLNGGQIIAEEWEDKLLVYLYDASDSPIGMMYRTESYAVDQWDVFWFEKNLQGDVVAVYNSSGLKLASYTYDAWGNHTVSYSNNGASTSVKYNPFRYRGYYYDTDLQMYYLQSRYYDSKICRFINADGYVSTGQGILGNNMFAYCGNNPVNYVDHRGEFPWLIAIFLVATTVAGAIIGYCNTESDNQSSESELNQDEKIKNAIIGGSLGLASGGIILVTGAGVYGGFWGIKSIFLGVTAKVALAIGGLAVNIPAFLILPIFGIEISPIEYKQPSYNTNQPNFD